MCMYKLYAFPQDDGTEVGQKGQEFWERCRGCDGWKRYIVDFQARKYPADTHTVRGMAMRYDNDLDKAENLASAQ